MEGDIYNFDNVFCVELFQSTPSAWRETPPLSSELYEQSNFNPLPPHGGRPESQKRLTTRKNFNPLPPHGGRLEASVTASKAEEFQSTPSAWRETGSYVQEYSPLKFQSTPSAWRETLFVLYHRFQTFHFNPLPPHGGRHGRGFRITLICNFNPLPPHGGRLRQCLLSTTGELFQSTPSAWRETWVQDEKAS